MARNQELTELKILLAETFVFHSSVYCGMNLRAGKETHQLNLSLILIIGSRKLTVHRSREALSSTYNSQFLPMVLLKAIETSTPLFVTLLIYLLFCLSLCDSLKQAGTFISTNCYHVLCSLAIKAQTKIVLINAFPCVCTLPHIFV